MNDLQIGTSQRFSLYHLEEGEMYIKDFVVTINYYTPEHKIKETNSGMLYIGSRSLIFEPDDKSYSLIKFPFSEIPSLPFILIDKQSLNFEIKKMIVIPSDFTEGYKGIKLPEDNENFVVIKFKFEKLMVVSKIINELIEKYNNKSSYFEFDSVDYLKSMYNFKFDTTLIKSINEKLQIDNEIYVKKYLPLIEVPGLLMITDQRLYFQPLFKIGNKRCISLKFSKITELYRRRVNLRNIGVEIITPKKNIFLSLPDEKQREKIFNIIIKFIDHEKCETNINILKYTKLWCEGKISNYEYLIKLNSVGNRTRNDLSQYPIFPWTIINFTSPILHLEDPKNYRDLSKPIGALNPKRLKDFLERYNEMPGNKKEKFLYGTHYSTAAYIIGFLCRQFPEYMLKLHGGKFDHPDRLFSSIEVDWETNYQNPGCLKELIPEFFENNTEFLLNLKKINLGINVKNEKVGDVILPPWSDYNPKKFLDIMKKSLESDYVNENLHNWIDLIFGYKQRGEEAIKNNNLFHPSAYATEEDLKNKSKNEIKLLETQTREFGICPTQIFFYPHPKKFSKFEDYKEFFTQLEHDSKINNLLNFNNDLNNNIFSNTNDKEEGLNYHFEKINFKKLQKHHKQKITSMCYLKNSKILSTGSEDGFIKLYDIENNKTKRMANVSNLSLSTMKEINDNNLIAIGSSDNEVYILNTTLCKAIFKIQAHEDSIISLFINKNKKLLITDGADSTYKLWDISNQKKMVPIQVFYDAESTIISCDYREDDDCHICIDTERNLILRRISNNKDELVFKSNLEDKSMNFVGLNKLNLNEYYVASNKKFCLYDIRNNKVINTYDKIGKICYAVNDNNNRLFYTDEKIVMYKVMENTELNCVQEWKDLGVISCGMFYNVINDDGSNNKVVCAGNENGDVYYSVI